MAAMDQGKLDSMCNSINSGASSYVTTLTTQNKNMVEAFNANWVSNSSRKLASEIRECLITLENAITQTFSDKNDAIKMSVDNFNSIEEEHISYSGFSFDKPALNFELAAALPNGKVGVMDGANLKDIETPMKNLITEVCEILNEIKSKVSSADAFDNAEQEALTNSIERIKTAFETEMNDLNQSLVDRMSKEISTRDELDKTNIQNLES